MVQRAVSVAVCDCPSCKAVLGDMQISQLNTQLPGNSELSTAPTNGSHINCAGSCDASQPLQGIASVEAPTFLAQATMTNGSNRPER